MRLQVVLGPSSFGKEDRTPLEQLTKHGIDVIPNPVGRRLTEDEISALIQSVDGLVAGLEPLTERVLASATRLRAIARVGIGMDNVDIQAAQKRGIKVSNTPDRPADAVAEMTLAAMLTLCRWIPSMDAALHQGRWTKKIGISLRGTKVLVVGYGRTGRRVAALLRAFGSQILVYDPFVRVEPAPGEEWFDCLGKALASAEIVTLHAGGKERIIGAEEFGRMRDGTILLNSARGELVDESELLLALDSGKLRAAWLDVFSVEPYQGKLIEYPQVLLTPHASTYSVQCRRDMELEAVNNLLRDLGIQQ